MKSNTSYLARLFGYVSSSIPYFLISFFGFVLFAAAQVGAAEWLRRIVDFIENPNQTVQIILPLALIAIALIRGIGFYLSNFFMAFISNKLIHNLRVDLFKSLISMPVSFYDKSSSGHLLSRITFNVMQVSSAVTDAVKIIIREGLIVIGLLGYLIYLNWKLTLVLIIAAPLIGFIVSIAGKRLRRLSKKIQSAMGDVTHVSSESINAHKELKIFGNENLEIDKFNEASDANRIQNLKLESTNSIASPLIQLIISLALALITWFALDPSVITSMSSGTFIAFFGSAGMLAKPIRQLSSTNVMFQKGIAAAEDIFKQIDETPEKDDGSKIIKNSEYNYQTFLAKDLNEKGIDSFKILSKKPETLLIEGLSSFLSVSSKLNVKVVNKDVVLFKSIDKEKNYSESGIITRKTGELIHEITKNMKSENSEKYISIYSCNKDDKKV